MAIGLRVGKSFSVLTVLLVLLAVGPSVPAQDAKPKEPSDCPCRPGQIKMPQTTQDHRDLAEGYMKKAAAYREEAEAHRKMLAEYIEKRRFLQTRGGGEDAWIRQMRKHCEKFIASASALAVEAEDFAKFHLLRAAELEGK